MVAVPQTTARYSRVNRLPGKPTSRAVLTAVDHIVVCVDDGARAVETYRSLGFNVREGALTDRQVAYAVFGDFYIVFAEDDGAEGLCRLVLRSDDLETELARLRSAGIGGTAPIDDPLDGPRGSLARRTASVDAPIPLGLVQHQHDPSERIAFLGGPVDHPNTATVLERIYVVVESIRGELRRFEHLLGVPAPEPEMGTVIMSLMSVFYIGEIGIAVAEPRGPGPTAEALRSRGPGMFQVLFRAGHLDQAAGLMVDNGVPSPTRGTRLSGENALLVKPENACNVYVAFAGRP